MANFEVRTQSLIECAENLKKYSLKVQYFDISVNKVMNELKLSEDWEWKVRRSLRNISEKLGNQAYQNIILGTSLDECAYHYHYTESKIGTNQMRKEAAICSANRFN